jgi:hypothetical protein
MHIIYMDKLSLIFYICIASIIVWALLKAFGVFNTPVLVEMFPMIAGSVAAGVGFGKLATTLQHMEKRLKKIDPLRDRMTKIETTCNINHRKK